MLFSTSLRGRRGFWGFFFCFVFIVLNIWLHRAACRIVIPLPGIKHVPPAAEAQSLNHWTAREVPEIFQFLSTHFFKCRADHTKAFGTLDLAWGSLVCNFCSSQKPGTLHQAALAKPDPALLLSLTSPPDPSFPLDDAPLGRGDPGQ